MPRAPLEATRREGTLGLAGEPPARVARDVFSASPANPSILSAFWPAFQSFPHFRPGNPDFEVGRACLNPSATSSSIRIRDATEQIGVRDHRPEVTGQLGNR